jgi:hypothetical protein
MFYSLLEANKAPITFIKSLLTNPKNIIKPYYFCTTMIGMLCQIEWIEEEAIAF